MTKKIKRPTKVLLFNTVFIIRWVDSKKKFFGNLKGVEQIIEISEGQNPNCEADTIVHEIMHALFNLLGLNEKGTTEELLVRGATIGLMTAWMHNPELFAYVQQQLFAGRAK